MQAAAKSSGSKTTAAGDAIALAVQEPTSATAGPTAQPKRKAVPKGKATPKAAATGSAAAGQKRKAGEEPKGADNKKVDAGVDLGKGFKELSAIKTRMITLTGQCTDLFGVISTQQEWAWANHPGVLAPMTAQKQAVECYKVVSDFFKAWLIQDKFSAYAKRHFSEQVIQKELERIKPLSLALDALDVQMTSIKAMHNLRPQLPQHA